MDYCNDVLSCLTMCWISCSMFKTQLHIILSFVHLYWLPVKRYLYKPLFPTAHSDLCSPQKPTLHPPHHIMVLLLPALTLTTPNPQCLIFEIFKNQFKCHLFTEALSSGCFCCCCFCFTHTQIKGLYCFYGISFTYFCLYFARCMYNLFVFT